MDCYRPMWHIKPCSCFPGFNFQSTWSHEYHSPWWNMVYGSLTVHWANSESRPAEDPVDSDHFPGSPPGATDGLIQEDFAVPVWTLTVFFRLACSEVHIHLQTLPFRKCVKLHAKSQNAMQNLLLGVTCRSRTTVCHLHYSGYIPGCSTTTPPTRGYHSIMLIHDSLDTEAFQYLLSTISWFYVPPDPCGPAAPC